jgi:hypothetical protein
MERPFNKAATKGGSVFLNNQPTGFVAWHLKATLLIHQNQKE